MSSPKAGGAPRRLPAAVPVVGVVLFLAGVAYWLLQRAIMIS